MTSQGFLGVDGTRKETTLFRVENALYAGELNKMKASFFFLFVPLYGIHSATLYSLNFTVKKSASINSYSG